MDFNGIICPHCGYETGIEPALVNPDGPMQYCMECDEPLFHTESRVVDDIEWFDPLTDRQYPLNNDL